MPITIIRSSTTQTESKKRSGHTKAKPPLIPITMPGRYPSFPKAGGTPLPEDQIQLVHAKQKEFKAKMKFIEGTVTSGPHQCKGIMHDLQETSSAHSD